MLEYTHIWKKLQDNKIKINGNHSIFNELGHLKNFEYEKDLKLNANLEICPPKNIPHVIRSVGKTELDQMKEFGVIVYLKEPTPLVSPQVIVRI